MRLSGWRVGDNGQYELTGSQKKYSRCSSTQLISSQEAVPVKRDSVTRSQDVAVYETQDTVGQAVSAKVA